MRARSVGLVLVACAVLLPSHAQRRAKKANDADKWQSNYAAAGAAFAKKSFGACLAALHECTNTATRLWTKAVAAALPDRDGWTKKIKDTGQGRAAAAMLGLGSIVGKIVEASYSGPDGKRFTLRVHLDSAAVKMIEMQIGNPAMRQGRELIEYTGYKGLLEEKKNRCKLDLVLMGKHYVEGTGHKMTGDEVLGFMSQENIDRIGAAAKG